MENPYMLDGMLETDAMQLDLAANLAAVTLADQPLQKSPQADPHPEPSTRSTHSATSATSPPVLQTVLQPVQPSQPSQSSQPSSPSRSVQPSLRAPAQPAHAPAAAVADEVVARMLRSIFHNLLQNVPPPEVGLEGSLAALGIAHNTGSDENGPPVAARARERASGVRLGLHKPRAAAATKRRGSLPRAQHLSVNRLGAADACIDALTRSSASHVLRACGMANASGGDGGDGGGGGGDGGGSSTAASIPGGGASTSGAG